MRTLLLWMELMLRVLAPVPVHAFWEGKQDNLPVTELAQSDDFGLALEARSPCAHVVWAKGDATPPSTVQDARQYLDIIQAVTRHRHRGKVPPWMQEMGNALTAADLDACMAPLRRLKEETQQKATVPSSTPKGKTRK